MKRWFMDCQISKFARAFDMGAWEDVLHRLAVRSQITVPKALSRIFNSRHRTFIKRFDPFTETQGADPFSSAMTLLQRSDRG